MADAESTQSVKAKDSSVGSFVFESLSLRSISRHEEQAVLGKVEAEIGIAQLEERYLLLPEIMLVWKRSAFLIKKLDLTHDPIEPSSTPSLPFQLEPVQQPQIRGIPIHHRQHIRVESTHPTEGDHWSES